MIVTQPDRILLREQVRKFAGELRGSVLDVGGGDGKRYRHLLQHAESYRSLDTNAKLSPDVVGSAEDIPLDDASVDSILCTQLLEHLPHPRRALSEMLRALKPGGLILLSAPQWNELHEEPHDYFRYTCFGLRTMCEEVGLQVKVMDQRGAYHSCQAQMRIRYWIDRLQPYKRWWAMCILAPLSMVYTRYALWRDALDHSHASAKHAIGWALLLQKSS